MREKTPPGASSRLFSDPSEAVSPVSAEMTGVMLSGESAESLRKMPPSHRVETALLGRLFVESFGALAAEVEASIRWFGAALETLPAASDLLDATSMALTGEEMDAALAFYRGKQWPDAIAALRQRDARPMLVVNRLPELVATALRREREVGTRVLSPVEERRLIILLTRQNMDAQMLYNYALSALAEQLAAGPRPTVPDVPLEADGPTPVRMW